MRDLLFNDIKEETHSVLTILIDWGNRKLIPQPEVMRYIAEIIRLLDDIKIISLNSEKEWDKYCHLLRYYKIENNGEFYQEFQLVKKGEALNLKPRLEQLKSAEERIMYLIVKVSKIIHAFDVSVSAYTRNNTLGSYGERDFVRIITYPQYVSKRIGLLQHDLTTIEAIYVYVQNISEEITGRVEPAIVAYEKDIELAQKQKDETKENLLRQELKTEKDRLAMLKHELQQATNKLEAAFNVKYREILEQCKYNLAHFIARYYPQINEGVAR